jgi:erythromycin esterase-like protein
VQRIRSPRNIRCAPLPRHPINSATPWPRDTPWFGDASDYDPLLERIGDTRVVLLGEASHGTHEFYRKRARITRRLIEEKGFTVVAVEADWTDAYRVNRWVRGMTEDGTAEEALGGFRGFPTWMWRNADVLALIEWLREHNAGVLEDRPKVGLYGLDLYSLFASIEAVLGYLERSTPKPRGGRATGTPASTTSARTRRRTATRRRGGSRGAARTRWCSSSLSDFLLLLDAAAGDALREKRLERAIGVIYNPESERVSHYFNAALSEQFDAVVHWDRTRAVEPLELTSGWEAGEEAPETYPTGM